MSEQTQPAPSPSASSGQSLTFRAVEGGQETHSGTTLLVEAYAAIWLILMVWIATMWRKQRDLHARLDDVEKTLDRAAAQQKKK